MDSRELYRLARELQGLALDVATRDNEDATMAEVATAEDAIRHPGSTIGQICERTGLSQAAVSKAVAALVEAGYAATAKDPSDGRRTLVEATDLARSSWSSRGRRKLTTELPRVGYDRATAAELDSALERVKELLARR